MSVVSAAVAASTPGIGVVKNTFFWGSVMRFHSGSHQVAFYKECAFAACGI